MKKIIITLLAILICYVNFGQNRVELNNVEKIAKEVYKRKNNVGDVKITKPIPIVSTSMKDTLLYIVPYEKDGFAIVSGIYEVSPILGFCDSGIYDPDVMPPGLLYLIDKYKSEIEKIKTIKIKPTKQVKQQWEEYLSDNQLKSFTTGTYLLKTKWSQEDSFNDLCPEGSPAGCTAVAMAQILKYWECRISPSGSRTYSDGWSIVVGNYYGASANFGTTTYNWNNMHNTYAVSENKKLIFHAGVSCETHYTTSNGSSSTPNRARDAFVTYWGISSDADVRSRSMHLNTWSDDLKDELDLNRPILYSGSALLGNGHSWVLDAYYTDGNFNCNWGFGGDYNGPYSLGDFDPPGEYGPYNQWESAIFNVYPVQTAGVATPTLSNQSFTYNGAGYTLTIPPAFGATSYEWTTNRGTITGNGTSATLVANSTATVQVRASNSRCNIYSPYKSATITINYGPISAPNIICYSGSTVSIANVPNTTITWSGTNVSFPNGNTGTSVTVRATSSSTSGNGTITASFTVDGVSKTVSKTIWVGKPNTPTEIIPFWNNGMEFGNDSYYDFRVNPQQGATSYTWVVGGGVITEGQGTNWITVKTNKITGDNNINFSVSVRAEGCAASSYFVRTGWVIPGTGGATLLFTPNPAIGETTLTIETTSPEESIDQAVEWDIEVYSPAQNLKEKQTNLKGKSTKIQTTGWQEGVYIVRVKYKDEILTGKLVVKK